MITCGNLIFMVSSRFDRLDVFILIVFDSLTVDVFNIFKEQDIMILLYLIIFIFQFYLYFFATYTEKNATIITNIMKFGKSIILFLLKSYPLLKYVNKQEVTLYPGDVLWFPALVWHQVENASNSIGVAYKFFHLPSSFRSSKMLSTLFFFATRPFIFKSAILSKITKKEYIFNNEQN